ncbi:hypothetical protein Tco_1007771 [Tanacetum coccineum]
MGFKDRAYVYGAVSVDYSKIGTGPVRDADLEAIRFEKVDVNRDNEKGLNMVKTVEELGEGENRLIDDVVVETTENGLIEDVEHHIVRDETNVTDNEMSSKQVDTSYLQLNETSPEQEISESEVIEINDVDFSQDVVSVQLDEVANDKTYIILDDMWSKHEDTDNLQRVDVLKVHGYGETKVMETVDVEVKKEVSDQLLIVDLDQDRFGEDMNASKKVIGDIKTTELASSDPTVTVLTGLFVLLGTQIFVTSSSSLAAPEEEVSKEISHINAPLVKSLARPSMIEHDTVRAENAKNGAEMTEEEASAEQYRMFAKARAMTNGVAPAPKPLEAEPSLKS